MDFLNKNLMTEHYKRKDMLSRLKLFFRSQYKPHYTMLVVGSFFDIILRQNRGKQILFIVW